MSVFEWIDELLRDERPRRRADVPSDKLEDIKGIPLDYFWSKVEQHLPQDWCIALVALPNGSDMMYRAEAYLDPAIAHELGLEDDSRPRVYSNVRDTAYRALEDLFYNLRDGLP